MTGSSGNSKRLHGTAATTAAAGGATSSPHVKLLQDLTSMVEGRGGSECLSADLDSYFEQQEDVDNPLTQYSPGWLTVII